MIQISSQWQSRKCNSYFIRPILCYNEQLLIIAHHNFLYQWIIGSHCQTRNSNLTISRTSPRQNQPKSWPNGDSYDYIFISEICMSSQWCSGVTLAFCVPGAGFDSRFHHKRYSPRCCSCSLIDKRVEWLMHSSLTFALIRQPHGPPSRMYE